ncbi:TonB-dependent receptor [Bradyrhizobium sp. 182]|uniref:TonB-dependent receptor n=1 Tax=unclassified Bradyrhizobium TaxID=2631580 RepID=UPI001FF713B2|nr:TonB-dependent receptor [Bradyrhizobium sp. CW12]MCK1530516.1 TonB-dependent receptor [Bradyrhizobium sp. 182]MCK1594911.1 TonB-dependent receptor [Bradyrhizobium sp. 164]MCK1615723.1 TonB-dependent receptor [Bradyrhizobium sp. 159]MCK1645539.1 TonB-dependent receptor [Bradyrhizobium sp. 154]MCK1663991.1 TonB-dependent receptor [Bradyrhizobium sp. 153]MCK1756020.1 TonB-dependent receptor [Bradyrhizobium sp. 137]
MSCLLFVRPHRFLLASAALTSLAAVDVSAARAQQVRESLPPVEVSPAQSRKQAKPAGREAQGTRRATARRPATASAAPKPVVPAAAAPTPLNSNAVAESASRLGLTVRETPATAEVISAETMREQSYRTVSEVAQGAVGVTSGDNPAEPSAFSMRGFTNSQINTLYNGIKIGPQNMTSRIVDTANLEAVEFLKGPASLISGEGAAGGAINFVTKQPHTGPVRNEADFSWDSLNSFRVHYGSGGSTNVQGLDYRVDISRSTLNGFADDTNVKTFGTSGQLNYRISDSLKIWGAIEYREDRSKAYWGAPLVPIAFSGSHATTGIVSGNYVSNYNGSNLGAVTIDDRTFNTNYNVLDNRNAAQEVWLRGGFELKLAPDLTLKSQAYGYGAERTWFNNEIEAFNSTTNMVDRERFYVAHSQRLVGNITDLIWDTNIAGFDNRLVTTLSSSYLDFVRPGAANFPGDSVSLVNPDRGFYGPLTIQQQTARIDNEALSFEDRLKLTRTFALVGGLRVEHIGLDRNSTDKNGLEKAGFPFTKDWAPVTGRIGYTWEAVPGLTFFSQYATGADISANNIFLLGPTQPLELTTARTYETGVKHLFWDNRAEWSFSAYDIVRKNVYAAAGGMQLNIAGRQESKGVELAASVRPIEPLRLWGNIAFVDARYADYNFAGGSFSGNTPPNVPRIVANAGASYRFFTPWPVELGITGRHVGDRYNTDANVVTMKAYTVADVYAFVDIPKTVFNAVDQARLTFRVRNITDKRYAIWGDPFYPDQILLGAPRTYEISAAFKW